MATNDRWPERQDEFKTDSEIELERFYDSSHSDDLDYARDLGFPGEPPFTRGIYPTMYRGRTWTMRQYAGFGTAEETNRRYRYLIDQGQTGLSVAFDLPTQMGYDSDHPLAEGEVGKAGVAVPSLADMERLFDEIPIDKISTSMTINAPAAILLAMYLAVGEDQGVPFARIAGTTQNDILKEYIARKTYIFPPEFSMRLATDLITYCAEHLPKWNPISISGYHLREAGATASQELGYTFANAISYVEAVQARGMDVDAFAPQLSFFFSADRHFLEEIAKFRAARRLWARLMRDRFGAQDDKSMRLRFHTQTAGSSLTAQQPLNNVIRTTLEALSAVLGGTQSLHTNSFDEAWALPTERAVTLALRTQQIIAEESGAGDTVDPLGGSYALETLTDRLEGEAEAIIARVDKTGGMPAAIDDGMVQQEIAESAYRKQQEADSGERPIVGVNCYRDEAEPEPGVQTVSAEVRDRQIERLQRLRESRDQGRVDEALTRLQEASRSSDDNLMPFILDAVKAYATVGDICDALRAEHGDYHEPVAY